MSDQTAETTETPTPADLAPQQEQEAPAREPETDWKAEARKWEERAKANYEARQKLDEIEQASKTVEEKLAEAQARLNEYETREQVQTWAAEITKGSHIPADALRGSSRDELQAHFDQLKSLIPTSRGPVIPGQGREPRTKPVNEASEFVSRLFSQGA